MDRETYLRIKRGIKNSVMIAPGIRSKCKVCGDEYDFSRHIEVGQLGIPLWLSFGFFWAFAHEHGDCKEIPEEVVKKKKSKKK